LQEYVEVRREFRLVLPQFLQPALPFSRVESQCVVECRTCPAPSVCV
jgi:hypothetical protein